MTKDQTFSEQVRETAHDLGAKAEMWSRDDNEVARERLKSRGFRWSRDAGAWQRQLTAGGFLNWQAIIGAELALGVEVQNLPAVRAAGERLANRRET